MKILIQIYEFVNEKINTLFMLTKIIASYIMNHEFFVKSSNEYSIEPVKFA